RCPIVMLTAEGTRPRARAAAENEPWSSTARNTATALSSNGIDLSVKLKVDDCCHQNRKYTVRCFRSKDNMQGMTRRLVYVGLYEAIAVVLAGTALALITGKGAVHTGALAVGMSVVA